MSVGFGLSSASALAAEPSASGGGTAPGLDFGFTAQSHSDGSVSGNGEFTEFGLRFHVRIDCLVVIGEDAYMSGKTTEQTDGLAEGTEMLFGVRDNDATGLSDLISFVFFSPGPFPFTCQTFHAPLTQTVTSGNVEVRSG
jgi:hypothetical protein